MSYEFRVTVEDLVTGDRQVTEFARGDYVLIPFAPCLLASAQAYPTKGTHVITIKNYRPAAKHRTVEATTDSGTASAPAQGPHGHDNNATQETT
jgi:hypothetical protein